MQDTPTIEVAPEEEKRKRRRLLAILFVMLAAVGMWTLFSSSTFVDRTEVPDNVFNVGEMDLEVGPTRAVFSVPAMAPGDVVTRPVTVTNRGNMDLRYSFASESDEAVFASVATLAVRTGVAACDAAGFTATGANALSGANHFGARTPALHIGDPAPGQQPGDRVLAAGQSEVLCMQVSLPLTVGDEVQGAVATVDFLFEAEQTLNND